ncbi:MAG: hypothetical protein HON76_07990 [Candidatus Scalindua sp.]|jgi:TorA maturation chaperone TorD|nr:hypothetical protein [Candidatus Scalindua sp.]MBT5304052.1 hypothetical protein [Candidatus Scalindua sp.]MBT6052312.1 hypothetical protein [Candidatus Scalindua sp.]MBT6229736.1 hypothetical protein [Candidatus Scalindua sp.]MBT6562452.1 hypothetical protein [Candidatus Scalindua sp.]
MKERELIICAAENRSKLYWFMGTLFLTKPDKEFIALLSDELSSVANDILKTEIEALRRSLETRHTSDLAEQLEHEFTRLFRGIHNNYGPPPPYESVYRESNIMGDSTRAVIECYSEAGFGEIDKSAGPQDHLGVELKFIALLCQRESQQREAGKDTDALNTLKMEKAFLNDHLLQWMPDFQGAVARHDPHPFYEALVSLTSRVLVLDNEYITGLLSELEKDEEIHDRSVVSG